MNATPLERKRGEIDAKIQEHEQALLSLKAQRNQLAPISRLSPDVLLYVFQHVQHSSVFSHVRPSRGRARSPSQLSRTKAITHICSTWRTLALGDPSLWTTLEFECPPLTIEMSRRSRSTPLSIYYREIEGAPNTSATFLRVLDDHLDHIKFLSVSAYSKIWRASLTRSLVLGSQNHLEGFWCENRSNMGYGYVLKDVELPLELLLNSAYALRNLGLLGCNFPKSSLSAHSMISLPHLSRIHLLSPPQSCADFLGHITFPPSCTVLLEAYDRIGDFSSLGSFIRRFSEARSASGFPFTSLIIGRNLEDLMGFFIRLQSTSGSAEPEHGFELFVHYAAPLWPRTTQLEIILAILPSVQLHQICYLELDCDVEDAAWTYLAESCVQMTHLVASGLGISMASPSFPPDIPTTFPNMESLVLRRCDFDPNLCRILHGYLEHRFEKGIPIRTLVLEASYNDAGEASSDFIGQLQAFVTGEITYCSL
ncbi:hypothetical protein BDN72DRAFT_844651 [Pluteus cervinus]|uniref:Uncharacterized protein n=1 Tax=Pluteus cervinus TaxID=181527 RepID=A0ACD3AL14_9AGAR|nr:hypothetical protein BDN72DRAFT_844651 [Pluteus cervinus]